VAHLVLVRPMEDAEADRITRLLMEFDEFSQTAIKGHLLIEERLSQILDLAIGKPEILSKARLTFVQKLRLVQALSFLDPKDDMWEVAITLNRLRNEMAHQLDSPKIDDIMKDIYRLIQFAAPAPSDSPRKVDAIKMESLALAVIFAHGFLGEYLNVLQEGPPKT
jgi:hypothetical protein